VLFRSAVSSDMLAFSRRFLASSRVAGAPKSCFSPIRAMSDQIPKDQGHFPIAKEQAVGKARAEEVYTTTFKQEYFDRDALAVFDSGTKENPIAILSNEHERYVGVSVEEDSNIRWFKLKEGELAYDAVTMNYFALCYVDQHQVDSAVAEAEKVFE